MPAPDSVQPPKEESPKPPGKFRNYLAWVLAFIGVNPGYKPWDPAPQIPPKRDDAK